MLLCGGPSVLQTGLASWATLRHATVLVNERVSAECGEGAFEFIEMRPPRGYVEPDVKSFGRIADLFASAVKLVSSTGAGLAGTLPAEDQASEALQQGLIRRLKETEAKARLFQTIAQKETGGEPLTAADYEEILYFGRVAEHHFLIYKSLANKDLALSMPNPIPKIADISDVGGGAPYGMVAVGRLMVARWRVGAEARWPGRCSMPLCCRAAKDCYALCIAAIHSSNCSPAPPVSEWRRIAGKASDSREWKTPRWWNGAVRCWEWRGRNTALSVRGSRIGKR